MNRYHKWLKIGLLVAALGLLGCTPSRPVDPIARPSTVPATAGQVEANGITIAYESFGAPDHETVLLIPGTGMQLVDWPLEMVEELVRRGYRVVRIDNRDVGRSTKLTAAGLPDSEAITRAIEAGEPPPLPYTLRDMAKDAVGVLDALAIQHAHLVGISMGGAIAQLVAIDDPDRTLSLTLLAADSSNPELPVVANPDAFADVPPQPTTADRAAFIAWQVKVWQAFAGSAYPPEEATLRTSAARYFDRGFDPAGLTRHQTVILVDRYESTGYRRYHLETIVAPTVVLHGTDDPLVPVAAAKELAARVPGAALRLIPGLGHEVPVALVPVFAAAIEEAASQATD